jgi:hypothetical protein
MRTTRSRAPAPMTRREFVAALGVGGSYAITIGSKVWAQTAPAKFLRSADGTFFSAPPAAFDPIMGYRWLRGPIRLVRVINGELITDSICSGNNYGYNCSYDFTPKKPSRRAYRLGVLGDSFTAGLNMPLSWPQRLQQLLRSRPERWHDLQVYPFAIDGGGLLNWYSVFVNQILPEFEFDGLIIASWYEDLGRKWIVLNSDSTGMYILTCDYNDRPQSREAFEAARPRMQKLYDISSNNDIAQMVERISKKSELTSLNAEYYCKEWTDESELAPPGYAFSTDVFVKRYGTERLTMFTLIVDECRKRGVPIIFCSVPTRQGVLRAKRAEGPLLHRAESEGLSRRFGLHYFDGYGIFEDIDAKAIVDLYWQKYDAHWDQIASDLFALKLAELIARNKLVDA